MNQPDADRYIVSGVREVHVQGQRWVDRKGVIQVLAPPFLDLHFHLAFTLPPAVANKAGVITLRIAVNDELFGAFTYTEAGTYEIKKPVAAESLPWDRNTEISLEIEPLQERELGAVRTRFPDQERGISALISHAFD